MIQRIQTLWLFLAAFVSGLLFIMPVYKYEIPALPGVGNSAQLLQASQFYPLLIIAAVMTLIPLIAIFMYLNRKRQRRMAIISILACISFIGVMMMKINNIKQGTPAPVNEQYVIPGSLLPVLPIIFLIMAIIGINKDEKLVRSMDRLR
jgi:hypothetical protein